jgi:hypothetical protein
MIELTPDLTDLEKLILAVLDSCGDQAAAWQKYEITGNRQEAEIVCTTNDDNDDGIPDGEITTWIEEGYKGTSPALKRTGVCRYGVSGVAVFVSVNGVPVA